MGENKVHRTVVPLHPLEISALRSPLGTPERRKQRFWDLFGPSPKSDDDSPPPKLAKRMLELFGPSPDHEEVDIDRIIGSPTARSGPSLSPSEEDLLLEVPRTTKNDTSRLVEL